MDDVLNVNDVGCAHNQAVAHAIVGLEYEHRAGTLIGQFDLRREGGAHAAEPSRVGRLFAMDVMNRLAGSVDGEYVARIDAMALAAVDYDDLILTDVLRAIDHRDDAAVNIVARRAQHEVQR